MKTTLAIMFVCLVGGFYSGYLFYPFVNEINETIDENVPYTAVHLNIIVTDPTGKQIDTVEFINNSFLLKSGKNKFEVSVPEENGKHTVAYKIFPEADYHLMKK